MTTITTPNKTEALRRVPVTQIKPGINPRTRFDEENLRELGATMLTSQGPVQPLIVYLDDDGMYGLIAGERRWRAAVMVGIEELEIIPRAKPNAKDARRMALLENMQRENLTALEIAWAVRDQLAEKNEFGVPVYTKAMLAEELGKDPSFVSWCEALLRCSERLQQAVHEGRVEMRLAAMVGSLPTAMHEMAEREMVFRPVGPMALADAGKHVADKYKRDLRKAQFDAKAEGLIEGAPACANCEFNGARRSDLQGKNKHFVCLNVACFDAKQLTVVSFAREHSAAGDGVKMLGDDKREAVFSFDGVTVRGDSGYVAADEVPDGDLVAVPNAKRPTWGDILKDQPVQPMKIVDGEGRLRTLYDARLAVQAATADDSQARTIFKPGATAAGKPSASGGESKIKAAQVKARATGCLAAASNWLGALRECDDTLAVDREITRLLLERVTEPVDREWMAKALGVTEVIEHLGDGVFSRARAEVLGLALVARTLRLQGPGGVQGITGDLCQLTGYKPAQEAKKVEALVAAAGKPEKRGRAKPEKLVPAPAEPAKQRGGKRVKNAAAEEVALKVYLETGSIAKAAAACGLDVESVKNWHKRRGWKALREANLNPNQSDE